MINKFKRFKLYFYTLRYLKLKQIFYQVYYRIKRASSNGRLHYNFQAQVKTFQLNLIPSISAQKSYEENRFTFLNKEKIFYERIDWNFKGYGKLWVYNLNYFEFLHQENFEKTEAIKLLDSFIEDVSHIEDGIESYPISLRGINWIKFFSHSQINDHKYNTALLAHYNHLMVNLEYHLLGNHLLENAFSLLFGAYYFRNNTFYTKAKILLEAELDEQILKDGAHFELSPMYHQILMFRLLDCINLLKHNQWREDNLLLTLLEKARQMLCWLKTVTFSNGDIPMVNDSSFGFGPSSSSLITYAKALGIIPDNLPLNESGYRMIREGSIELFIDIGNIGPDYIPGHAHSDTFNFLLYVNGFPLIVEAGTSTYENGEQRQIERSTQSHNTVILNDQNQSDVWGGFRVGRRAKIISIEENRNEISASHDGYKRLGITHKRKWCWAEGELFIHDEIVGAKQEVKTVAAIHFHPMHEVKMENGIVYIYPHRIHCSGSKAIELEDYSFASGFNQIEYGKVMKIHFNDSLEVSINLGL